MRAVRGRGGIAYMMTDDPMKLPASTYAGVAFRNQGTFFGAGNGGNRAQAFSHIGNGIEQRWRF